MVKSIFQRELKEMVHCFQSHKVISVDMRETMSRARDKLTGVVKFVL